MTFSNGDFYEGEWRDDKQHGIGKYSWKNGDFYEGHWVDNRLELIFISIIYSV